MVQNSGRSWRKSDKGYTPIFSLVGVVGVASKNIGFMR